MPATLRAAWRALRAAPGYALAATTCIALGLGANAAVFEVADAIFFRPPPGVRDAGRLARVTVTRGIEGVAGLTLNGASTAELAGLAAAARGSAAVRAVAAYDDGRVTVGGGADARPAQAVFAAPGYWAALGVRPARGRTFGADEERAGAAPLAAVVSHRYWATALRGAPDAVGRPLVVNGITATVVGVAPAEFNGADLTPRVDVWLPLARAGQLRGDPPGAEVLPFPTLRLAVRLRNGVAPADAAPSLAAALTASAGARRGPVRFTPPRVQVGALRAGDQARADGSGRLARWLAAVSGLVLVVACANVAGLALARGVARRRELALRAALGASRRRLVGDVAAEGALLAAAGAAASLAVWAGVGVLLRRFPALPEPPAPDWRMAAFLLALTAVVAVACGVVPALLATRGGLRAPIHEAGGAAAGASAGRARARELLLVGQLAVTLVLLAGAGLFLRSLANAQGADLGFAAERLVTLRAADARTPDPAAAADAMARLRERAAALPGVAAASLAEPGPFAGFSFRAVEVPGAPAAAGDRARTTIVGADEHYVPALGLRVLRGRALSASDRPAGDGPPRAVAVNETMARRDWPGQDPLGRCVRYTAGRGAGACMTVVGVYADARTERFASAPGATIYEPRASGAGPAGVLLVRLAGPADARAAAGVRATLAATVPGAPALTARPLLELLDGELAPHRLGATLFTLYGALALLLAAVGLYGVVRYNVERRTRELAVRTALGARPGDVARLVVGGGTRLALAGAAIGLVAAVAASRLLAGLLFRVSPADPLVVGGASAVLVGVAALASWLPARRAARVDPATALRSE